MLNKAQIIGNLGANPKTKTLDNQSRVSHFTVATTEKGYVTQQGVSVQNRTEWHNVVCYGKLADVAGRYLRKGSRLFVEGKMRTRSYTDANGIKRNIMEINAEYIELLDNKGNSQQE